MPINYVRGLMSSTTKPMTLAEFRAGLSAVPLDAFKTAESFPSNWKSMTSGKKFLVRKEEDVVYVEWVPTDDQKKLGLFQGVELHKGKDGYTGKEHVVMIGSYFDRWKQQNIAQRCTFDWGAELSVLSPSRVEGRFLVPPSDSKLDVKKCAYDKAPIWQGFVWIPE